jgi:hypothetical protein
MGRRLDLHAKLVSTLGPPGSVYFQPPENQKIVYPAIVYRLSDISASHADNNPYIARRQYECTYIYTNPDDEMVDVLARLPTSRIDRTFIIDGLYHAVYNITE